MRRAFLAHNPPKVRWESELSVGGCACPLPDWLEDEVPARLINFVMRSLNRYNPIVIDLRAAAEEEKQSAIEKESRHVLGSLEDQARFLTVPSKAREYWRASRLFCCLDAHLLHPTAASLSA